MAAAPPVNYGNYPLKDIPAPHAHDVLCGRGGGTNNHIGNSHWRMLVAANKQLYITLPKRQKMLLSRSIVNAVRSQNPPGRFLQKDSKTNQWFDVGDQRAQEKTSQALREGAPDIRKKVAAQADDVPSTDAKAKTDDKQTTTTSTPTSNTTAAAAATSSSTNTNTTTAAAAASVTNATTASSTQQQANAAATPTTASVTGNASVPVAHPYNMMGQQQQQQQPQQAFMPAGMMPANFVPNGGQGVFYYTGPNMQPVQMYPTMVLNEQGMMVPGMSMMPGTMPVMAHAPQPQVPTPTSAAVQGSQPASNATTNDQSTDNLEPMPLHAIQEGGNTPTFDEFVAAPPEGLDGGLSFGSVLMSDAEMMKLQHTGTSMGSTMSYKPTIHHPTHSAQPTHPATSQQQGGNEEPLPQALNALEPTGISFGDVSMMSTGTNRLEAGGTSFGTMMSYTTMPDGGLEAIGTSFGSLSLDATNRDHLFQQLELAAGGPEIPPMFHSEDKATGNLLECSDTESEDSQSRPELVAQKSAAWEKMQASVTQLQQSQSKGTLGSNELMPPPSIENRNGAILSVPTLQRDLSQLSANQWDDDAAAPPPTLTKQGSDNEEALVGYISQQQV